MKQPDFFDLPLARDTDPTTSHEAAARVGEFASEHHQAIILALTGRKGTIYQIGEWTGLTHVQVARRMVELERGGIARPDGTAEGPTGRQCRVWRLK
jgi:hypothetical protein